ncbi:hypothetical protein GCM10010357_36520 [Streptomyces luteireticuli]|uniref:Uncharacterized protein n=1 Tax=Streptomyces luteireticuli TaxID=173858 RepID=A0ABN0YV72_9ACTN
MATLCECQPGRLMQGRMGGAAFATYHRSRPGKSALNRGIHPDKTGSARIPYGPTGALLDVHNATSGHSSIWSHRYSGMQ